ncbi:hypothetical protein DOK_12096 [gamma proteobacterium BDW918]|nr:hypothetical protein DOK_12096 [gamma proteobacterium BDW918]
MDNCNFVTAYVTGVGWCYMCDGEIVEVIDNGHDQEGHGTDTSSLSIRTGQATPIAVSDRN